MAALTYRQLLAMARERLGPAAAALKTREELLRGLGLEANTPLPSAPEPGSPMVVTSDFFIARKKSGAKN